MTPPAASPMSHGPGSKIHYQYNARHWITDVQNLKTDSTVIYTAHYDYNDGSLWDQTGNPLKKTENIGGTTYVTTYRYDRLYRLIEETKRDSSNNIVNTETYTYDAVGNRLTRAKDGTTYTSTYGYNNKLSTLTGGGQSASFSYDGDGNITGVTGSLFGSWAMTYNDSDELVNAVRPGGTDTYLYNALGQRLRSSIAGSVLRYVYFGDRVAEDDTSTGALDAYHTLSGPSYGDDWLFSKRTDSDYSYPILDLTGTARELVNGSAAVTDTYTTDAFGVKMASDTGTTRNSYGYDGDWGYFRDGSGLYQPGARFYWPELGRFIQQDPSGEEMNWYAYVGNNPVTAVDPDGNFLTIALDIGFIGYDGYQLYRHPSWKNGAFLAADVILAVIPGAPNGVSAQPRTRPKRALTYSKQGPTAPKR